LVLLQAVNVPPIAPPLPQIAGHRYSAATTGEQFDMPHYTALVTTLVILFYFYVGYRVPLARRKFGVKAPATTGNPDFERVFRVHMNMLEWMPIFLPLLWLFAFYVSDIGAAVLGLAWIAARAFYMVSYSQAADKRGPGFGLQVMVCLVLLIGAVAGIVGHIAHGG
jgi:glutathione S-transferase